jgi:hypothetical protein
VKMSGVQNKYVELATHVVTTHVPSVCSGGACEPECESGEVAAVEGETAGLSCSEEAEGSPEVCDEESEEEDEELDAEEASPEQLLALGKQCLAAGDATGAVDHFQDACSLL